MTAIEAAQLLKLPQHASIQDIEYAYKLAYDQHLDLINSTNDKALNLKYNLSIQRIYKAYILLRETYEKWYNTKVLESNYNYNKNLNNLYAEAYAFYKLKDYQAAFPILNNLFAAGHPEAVWILGVLYSNGWGVEKDLKKAFELYDYSAKKGSVNSLNNLGYFYLNGIYVEIDYSKAFVSFEECSKSFHPLGINNLAFMYLNGLHVNKDPLLAIEMFIKSSDLGCPVAMHNLAYQYLYGEYISVNFDKAFQLLRASSNLGHIPSYNSLAIMYEFGKGNVPVDLQQAIKLYKIAAYSGNLNAKVNLERLGVRFTETAPVG